MADDAAPSLRRCAPGRPWVPVLVRRMRATTASGWLLASLVIMAIRPVGCAPAPDNPWAAIAGPCLRHDACPTGQACVMGACVAADLDAPASVDALEATAWFDSRSGVCEWDDACGPWACHQGACVAPSTAGITPPARRALSYYDLSCRTQSDCGPWVCADGWCHAPGRIGPDAALPTDEAGVGTGVTCLSDDECGRGQECVHSGYCHVGRGGEPMTFIELGRRFRRYGDGSCNADTDCGPEVCHAGWCMPREVAGATVRTRADYRFYDSSCLEDQDCFGWTCEDGWCEDPTRSGADFGTPAAGSEAARSQAHSPDQERSDGSGS